MMIAKIHAISKTGKHAAAAHRHRVTHGSGLSAHLVHLDPLQTAPVSRCNLGLLRALRHPPTNQRIGRKKPRKKRVMEAFDRRACASLVSASAVYSAFAVDPSVCGS